MDTYWSASAQHIYMLLGGVGADQACLPRPAYLRTTALLNQKRGLARLGLSAASIQTNQFSHAVPFTQRRCTCCNRGVDTEHHLLFDCPASEMVIRVGRTLAFVSRA